MRVVKNLFLIFILIQGFFSQKSYSQTDTLFWFVAPEVSPNNANFNLPIAFRISTLNQAASVEISMPANPGFTPILVNIPANNTQSIDLSTFVNTIENKPANQVLNKGIRIRATNNISVYYEVVSSFCNCNPEIFALKGQSALGTAFFTPFQNILNNSNAYNPQPYSAFDIVATENNTVVTITPFNAIVGHPAGVPFTVNLNKGETYSARAASQNAALHLHGSKVTSNLPIAITIKDDLLSGGSIYGGCADLAGDQIIPVDKTGKEYVVTKGFLNAPDRVFIVATQNNTQLTIAGNVVATINEGQTFVAEIAVPYVFIESTEDIYVLQLSGYGCEVGYGLLPPVTCTGSQQIGFTRSVAEDFQLLLMVQTGGEGNFILNGNAGIITSAQFNDVPFSNGEWKAATVSLNTAQVPVGLASLISNSTNRFHLGIIHGSPGGGCRYGFFSDFAAYQAEAQAAATDICDGDDIFLGANTFQNATYNWTGPNGFNSTNQSPIIENAGLTAQGYYFLNADIAGCLSSTDSVFITVNPIPVIDTAGFNAPICEGDTLILAANPLLTGTYDWTGPNNFSSNLAINTFPNAQPNLSGIYSVTLTENGCTSLPIEIEVEVAPTPLAPTLSSNSPICEGEILNINNENDNADTYQWLGPNNFSSTEQNLTFNNTTTILSGIYTATYQIGFCVSDPQTIEIVVKPTPEVGSIDGDIEYCEGDNVSLAINNPVSDATYSWFGPNNFTSNAVDIEITNATAQNSGTYSIRVILDECIGDTVEVTVLVKPNPTIPTINVDGNFCVGTNLSLNASSNDDSDLAWITPNGETKENALLEIPNLENTDSGIYTVIANLDGCETSLTFPVNVLIPEEPYWVNTFVCPGQTIFIIPGEYASYLWEDGNTVASLPVNATGTYSVLVTDSNGCQLTTSIEVTDLCPSVVTVPNVFTPNGDGVNDQFLIEGVSVIDFQIEIYNRWGNLVYTSDNLNAPWDGKTKGSDVPEGVYFYIVRYTGYSETNNLGVQTLNGNITLIR